MAVTVRRLLQAEAITASCPPTTIIGDMVYVDADRVGELYSVGLCNIAEENKRPIGIVTYKIEASTCMVQVTGIVKGVYLSLIPYRALFLGIGAGARLTQSPPGRPLTGVRYIQQAGWPIASDRFILELSTPITVIPH